MLRRRIKTGRYTFKSRRVIWPPFPKTILIALNKSADKVIETIDEQRRNEFYNPHSSLFSSSHISNVEWSTLLLEDRHYFEHAGVEPFRALLRTTWQLARLKRLGGISTIEQQLVRTVLDDRRRTISRKVRESIVANAITYRKRKIDILRTYLEIAYFGYRLKGVNQATAVFRKYPPQLNDEEADFVSCLLVYPLPKPLYMWLASKFAECQQWVPTTADIIEKGREIAPRWSERVDRRRLYAAKLRGGAVKPSYEVYGS